MFFTGFPLSLILIPAMCVTSFLPRKLSLEALDISDVINFLDSLTDFTRAFIPQYHIPFVPSHLHSINDSLTAEKAANEYEFIIRQLVRTRVVGVSEVSDCPRFDLILLGMGDDGHVASLFPNHSVLDEESDWVTYIIDSPKPPPERITFTLPVIKSSANVAVVVTGSNKADMVHLAIDDVGPECPSLPAKMIQPINGKLLWFLDKSAASKVGGAAQISV